MIINNIEINLPNFRSSKSESNIWKRRHTVKFVQVKPAAIIILQEFVVGHAALNSFILWLAECIYLQVHIKQPHILRSVGITLNFSDGPTTRTICASEQKSKKKTRNKAQPSWLYLYIIVPLGALWLHIVRRVWSTHASYFDETCSSPNTHSETKRVWHAAEVCQKGTIRY